MITASCVAVFNCSRTPFLFVPRPASIESQDRSRIMATTTSNNPDGQSLETPVSLDTLAAEIMAAHTAALTASRSAVEHARRAGELLLQKKAQLAHGQWLPWLAANCDLKVRTAQEYMQIARGWPQLEEFANTRPAAHLDITTALMVLKGTWSDNEAEDAHENDPDDADELAPGGCADSGNGTDTGPGTGVDTATAAPRTQQVYLVFTDAALVEFWQQVKELAAHFELTTDNQTDQLRGVVASAHAELVRKGGESNHGYDSFDGHGPYGRRGGGPTAGHLSI
jgi:hypothetical protein